MTKQINPYATYGLMGLPLAFVALPLYVHLPSHLSTTLGWSLGFTGSLLMAVRLFDAFIDPALGRWSDRLLASSPQHLLIVAACAAALVMLGLVVLFSPAIHLGSRPQWLIGATLLLVGSANSLLTIAHQAWGPRWSTRTKRAAGYLPGVKAPDWWAC